MEHLVKYDSGNRQNPAVNFNPLSVPWTISCFHLAVHSSNKVKIIHLLFTKFLRERFRTVKRILYYIVLLCRRKVVSVFFYHPFNYNHLLLVLISNVLRLRWLPQSAQSVSFHLNGLRYLLLSVCATLSHTYQELMICVRFSKKTLRLLNYDNNKIGTDSQQIHL